MSKLSRREFLGAAIATTGAATAGTLVIKTLANRGTETGIIRDSITPSTKVPLGKAASRPRWLASAPQYWLGP